MTERIVAASWRPGPLNCTVTYDTGATQLVDEPVDVGGTGQGPQPTDLFLASVSSCFTLALVYAAGKAGLRPTSIDVRATGVYAGPRFESITIHAALGGVDPADHPRLIASAERVCYVTNTLRRPPEITVATT